MEDRLWAVLGEVAVERQRQEDKWGEQTHPNGSGPQRNRVEALEVARQLVALEERAIVGGPTWRGILTEEITEAFVEDEPARLREELVQVAAVAVAWIEALDDGRAT